MVATEEVFPEVEDTFGGFSGFAAAGVLTLEVVPRTPSRSSSAKRKPKAKGKGRTRPHSASPAASNTAEPAAYQPVAIPPREELIQLHTVALAAADSVF